MSACEHPLDRPRDTALRRARGRFFLPSAAASRRSNHEPVTGVPEAMLTTPSERRRRDGCNGAPDVVDVHEVANLLTRRRLLRARSRSAASVADTRRQLLLRTAHTEKRCTKPHEAHARTFSRRARASRTKTACTRRRCSLRFRRRVFAQKTEELVSYSKHVPAPQNRLHPTSFAARKSEVPSVHVREVFVRVQVFSRHRVPREVRRQRSRLNFLEERTHRVRIEEIDLVARRFHVEPDDAASNRRRCDRRDARLRRQNAEPRAIRKNQRHR